VSTCLLLIDDGREDYLDRCLDSASTCLPPMDACVMVSDPDHELGFAGAIQAGWDACLRAGCEFVFHLESDFVFTQPVPLSRMKALGRFTGLAQVALKRQPWNEQEKAAGGIVETSPDDFTERTFDWGTYTQHRRCFTTNPCLYRTNLCHYGWPQVSESEGVFSHFLLERGFSFAFWGGKFDPSAVEHIGVHRTGTGY
jgi:hypothetical protein